MARLPYADNAGAACLIDILALDPDLARTGDVLGLDDNRLLNDYRLFNHDRLRHNYGLLHYDRLLNDRLLNNDGVGLVAFGDGGREKARAKDACTDCKAAVTVVVMMVVAVAVRSRGMMAYRRPAVMTVGTAGIRRLERGDGCAKCDYERLLHFFSLFLGRFRPWGTMCLCRLE